MPMPIRVIAKSKNGLVFFHWPIRPKQAMRGIKSRFAEDAHTGGIGLLGGTCWMRCGLIPGGFMDHAAKLSPQGVIFGEIARNTRFLKAGLPVRLYGTLRAKPLWSQARLDSLETLGFPFVSLVLPAWLVVFARGRTHSDSAV
jgi:hypothetical protein